MYDGEYAGKFLVVKTGDISLNAKLIKILVKTKK